MRCWILTSAFVAFVVGGCTSHGSPNANEQQRVDKLERQVSDLKSRLAEKQQTPSLPAQQATNPPYNPTSQGSLDGSSGQSQQPQSNAEQSALLSLDRQIGDYNAMLTQMDQNMSQYDQLAKSVDADSINLALSFYNRAKALAPQAQQLLSAIQSNSYFDSNYRQGKASISLMGNMGPSGTAGAFTGLYFIEKR